MATIPSTEQSKRIVTLDIVRGVAVMGILAMNIVAFAMPPQAYINPLAYGADRPVDLAAYAFNFVLIDGKMRGLFSFLFGASMLLVAQMALLFEQPQHGPDGRIARRVWKVLRHLRGGGLTALIHDVHDLPLAAAQVNVGLLAHLRVLALCDDLSGSAAPVRRQRAKNLASRPAAVKGKMLFF